ncbi:MAG: helix-turn-helix transcriptional regulator, partial [Planctomycetota bacterium]|nr:helix-turn-helix transcriptional regulator [Planctomycetota bacterium]
VPMRLTPAHYVERAREFLHADYRNPIALPDLAERVGLSVTHLHRLFVGQMRLPPMAYLRQYRLRRASEMLAQTARPVREIARDVGIPEPERFTKAFRQVFGCSPREYRKQALKAEPSVL